MVISRVTNNSVARLVYLCAFVPLEGQSLLTAGSGRPASWIRMLEGDLMQPDPAQAGTLFYSDCDPEIREWARSRIRPQSAATMMEPVAHPAWRKVPSMYVVCANDKAIPPDLQRNVFGPRATKMTELQAGHSPFLSQPNALADVLAASAGTRV
jgi:pimeloyl-ACP methyl ester carboxylesterase